jgi:hypothetical protein
MSEIHGQPLQERNLDEHEPEAQGREEERAPADVRSARELSAGGERQQDEHERQPAEDAH